MDNLKFLDPIVFAESVMGPIKFGVPFRLRNCGRDYLYELYYYMAFEATTERGKPVFIKKGRQVEMTTTALALDFYFMASGVFNNIIGLHAFPRINQSRYFSNTRLIPALKGSQNNYLSSKLVGKPTTAEVDFEKENILIIEATSESGDRLRTLSFDYIFFDESQDMTESAKETVEESLSRSIFGRSGAGPSLIFGTPKTKGTFYHKMWLDSDQRHYYLKCHHCGKNYPFYISGSDEWQDVWLYGEIVQCPFCKRTEEKAVAMVGGKWIPHKDPSNATYRGYAFNQLFIPEFQKEDILDKINKKKSKRKINNEILGEFYEGVAEPITFDEIISKCTDPSRHMAQRILRTQKVTFFGADWGGKETDDDAGSWTVYVAISILIEDEIEKILVENIYKGETDIVSSQVEAAINFYEQMGCVQGVADMGYGAHQVQSLQDRFELLGCWASGNIKETASVDNKKKIMTINRDFYMGELFEKIKNGEVIIPYDNPADTEWFIEHLCSMDIDIKTVKGNKIKKFVKGSGPNDGFMALLYAYLAFLYYKNRGFMDGVQRATNSNKSSIMFSGVVAPLTNRERMRIYDQTNTTRRW